MQQEKRDAAAVLKAARGQTVVVFGDLMLDEWIVGSASRISPEAPVPVVRFAERRTAPGGAANVAMNLLRLGARVRVCGVVGDDEAGADLARELSEAGIDVTGLVKDASRPTTLKTRIVAQRQQMVRVDRESDAKFSSAIVKQLCAHSVAQNEAAKVLCLSDYDKGIAAGGAVEAAIKQARAAGMCVTGGPKPANLSRFKGADFLSLNQKEASEASGRKLDDDDELAHAGEMLRARLETKALAITRGGRGVTLFRHDNSPHHIAAHEVEVFDVAGAGDTFLAAASLALAGGANYVEAAKVGNLAAAASVRHVGVVAVTPEDVLRVAAE